MRDKHLGALSLVRSPHPNSNHNSAHNTPQREEETAHRAHLHQHNLFHNKRQTATAVDVQSVITEVVQTVSYVQQIDVDPNGSTFSIQTVLADSTGGEYVPSTTDTSAATTTEPASPGTSNTASSASSTVVGLSLPDSSSSTTQSLLSNQSTTSTSSSVSSIPTTSSFAFTICSNTTTLISSTSAFTPSFSNSTITSSPPSSSSFTYLSFVSSSSSSDFSSSTSSFYSPSYSSSSSSPTSTGDGGIIAGGGGTGAATGSTSTSTAAAGNGTSSGSSSAPSTSTVVGSVVGSVAGAAILIVVLMMFLRWKKRHQNMLSLGSGDPGPGAGTTRAIGPPPSQPTGGMSGPRSSLFAIPSALASLTGFKRSSQPADQTPTEAGGERGFYRVSGRKLPSVLQSGGDGYGDEVVGNTLSGSSFYRDSEGFYGGQGSPIFPAPLRTPRPESGIPVMRPSPARTPVTEPGPFAFPNPPAPLTPPLRPDVLGRSHPSQDGSHASRFTEEV